MKIIKWCHYIKTAGGRISAEHYFPITEENEWMLTCESVTMLGEAEDWAEGVNKDGIYTGWEYDYEFIDTPPTEWIEKKITYLKKSIVFETEYLYALENITA